LLWYTLDKGIAEKLKGKTILLFKINVKNHFQTSE
jgi:hypothetical protein